MRHAALALEDAEVDFKSEVDPPRILLVEDEGEAAESLSALLRLSGFVVSRACDGPSALLAARGGNIDAVVLDVMLPGMDGFEVCRRLRTDPATAALAVVMLTGPADTPSKVAGLNIGADEYLVRPVASLELSARVRELIEARETRLHGFRQGCARAAGDVASTICNEIVAPLAAALGTMDLLLGFPSLPPAVQRELESCQCNLARIAGILRRLDTAQDRAASHLGSVTMIDSGTAGAA
jgi:CheY-like chemotaxis protein